MRRNREAVLPLCLRAAIAPELSERCLSFARFGRTSARCFSSQSTPTTKKRKVAIACGYLGTEFDGLQRNPGSHSIEDVMLQALHRSGLVSLQHDLRSIRYSSSSRTDKGVRKFANKFTRLNLTPITLGSRCVERIFVEAPPE